MRRRKFTLIELILVMILLVVMVSATAPSLSNFFKGRKLLSEARRFMSVTKYASTLAASEGIFVTLELDSEEGEYTLLKRSFGEEEVVKRYELPQTMVLEIDPFENLGDEDDEVEDAVFESDVVGEEELEELIEEGGAELIHFSQSGYIIGGSIENIVISDSNDEDDYVALRMDDTHSRFIIDDEEREND